MECPGAGPRLPSPSKPHWLAVWDMPARARLQRCLSCKVRKGQQCAGIAIRGTSPAGEGCRGGERWRRRGEEEKGGKEKGREGGARGGTRTTKAAPMLALPALWVPRRCGWGPTVPHLGTWGGAGAAGAQGWGGGKARKKKTKGQEHVPGDRKEPDLVLMTPPGNGWASPTCSHPGEQAPPAGSQPCLLPDCISSSFPWGGGMFSPLLSWSWG